MTTTATDTTTAKAHPFELAGMGRGPYRFTGFWAMPGTALLEANPDAYNNAMADRPRLVNGCGTCANCGLAIMNICIVQDADGNHYGVGCDCVEKTGDASLGDKAKVALARHQKRQRAERAERKRHAEHQAWLAKVNEVTGETNLVRLQREDAERKAQQAVAAAKAGRIGAVLKPFADVLRDGRGGFADSVAKDMEAGSLPAGRGLDIALDIYAKRFGRRNSNAYEAANREACAIIEAAQTIENEA